MNNKQIHLMKQIFFSIVLLLFIRLAFFLQDGTNDTVESILRWIIFGFSVMIFGLFSYYKVDSFKELYSKYQDKAYLIIDLFLIDILFKIKNGLELTPVYLFAIGLIICLIVIFSLLIPKKASKVFDISLIVLYGIYVFSQDLYYNVFNNFFSLREAVNMQEGVESAEGTYYFSMLHVAIVLITIVIIVKYLKLHRTSHIKLTKNYFKIIYSIPLSLFMLVNINAQFPINLARLHLSDHYLYSSLYDKEQFVTKFSTVNLLFRDLEIIVTPSFSKAKDLKYVEDYYLENEKIHTDNDYTGMFENKNLIFIISESFDSIAISEELTPNIYKMKTEGIDFQNHYTPVFPRTTCDSEVIFNTSIIPSITEGPTCYVFNENSYTDSLPMIFNNADYLTAGFHNNYKEFYTRNLVYDGFGYSSFYGQDELGLSDDELKYDSIFGSVSVDLAIPEDQLFFSSMLTISGHSPYEETNHSTVLHYDAVDALYGDTYTDTIKGYIAAQIESDRMVGIIMDDLEAKGLLEDTVIIFTNDHYPYALDQDEYVAAKNITDDYLKNQGVLFIWNSEIEHEEITKLTSSFDILPTINNLFNLDGDYSKYIGNDIFSNNYIPMVYFKDYSIYDGVNHYSFSSEEDFANLDLIDIAQQYYELSKRILLVDYFKRD